MKVVYTGLESSGKSLALAMKAEVILRRNAKWLKKSGIRRNIVTNEAFSKNFVERALGLGIKVIIWEDLDQLISYRDCDVFIDELGTYFDSRSWTSLSLDVRRWIAQGAKSGIEIYAAAQDFSQIDIAFRRLTNDVFHIIKLVGSPRPSATRPPVSFIWGMCVKWELDPRSFKAEQAEMKLRWILPSFFFIRKKFCELFDTTQFLKRSKPSAFKHFVRTCPDCGLEKTFHE